MKMTKRTAAGLGRAMGWFSIGLGVAEVLGARPLARWLGVKGHEGKIRGFGFRELKAGVGILRGGDPTPRQMMSRVLGDAMDLAALGAAFRSKDGKPGPLAFATFAVVGATVVDVLAAAGLKWGAEVDADAASESLEDLARKAESVGEAFPMPQAIGLA